MLSSGPRRACSRAAMKVSAGCGRSTESFTRPRGSWRRKKGIASRVPDSDSGMPLEVATWLVRFVYAYLAIGIVLLPWWHLRGLRRLDLSAAEGPWGFRILISPGLVALWPWLINRAWHGTGHPPMERN